MPGNGRLISGYANITPDWEWRRTLQLLIGWDGQEVTGPGVRHTAVRPLEVPLCHVHCHQPAPARGDNRSCTSRRLHFERNQYIPVASAVAVVGLL